MYYIDMTAKEIEERLKARVSAKEARKRSIRIPVAIDDEILRLQEQIKGAEYTDAILILLEAGIEVLKGKKRG
jgi:hypothetical protein